jgi:hypothetical protein
MQKTEPVLSGAVNLPPTNNNERRGATVGTLKLYKTQYDNASEENLTKLPTHQGFIIIEAKNVKATKNTKGELIYYLQVAAWSQ